MNSAHAKSARAAAKKALNEAIHGHMKAQHELAHAKKVKNVSHKHYHAMKDAAAAAHKVLMKAEAEYSHCKGEAKAWRKREFIAKAVLNKASKAHKFAHHHMDDAHHEEKDAKRDLEKTRSSHASAHGNFKKAIKAMHRSKAAAIAASKAVRKHVREGMMAGHI